MLLCCWGAARCAGSHTATSNTATQQPIEPAGASYRDQSRFHDGAPRRFLFPSAVIARRTEFPGTVRALQGRVPRCRKFRRIFHGRWPRPGTAGKKQDEQSCALPLSYTAGAVAGFEPATLNGRNGPSFVRTRSRNTHRCAPPDPDDSLRKNKKPLRRMRPKGLAGAQISRNLCSGDTSATELGARQLHVEIRFHLSKGARRMPERHNDCQ
jgi:hypothetical protein